VGVLSSLDFVREFASRCDEVAPAPLAGASADRPRA
jgi:hypothetical protein